MLTIMLTIIVSDIDSHIGIFSLNFAISDDFLVWNESNISGNFKKSSEKIVWVKMSKKCIANRTQHLFLLHLFLCPDWTYGPNYVQLSKVFWGTESVLVLSVFYLVQNIYFDFFVANGLVIIGLKFAWLKYMHTKSKLAIFRIISTLTILHSIPNIFQGPQQANSRPIATASHVFSDTSFNWDTIFQMWPSRTCLTYLNLFSKKGHEKIILPKVS